MLLSRLSHRIGSPINLRLRFSQDDWTLFTLVIGYFFGWFVFASILFVLGACSQLEKGFNTDIGLKTVITHSPKTTEIPPKNTSQELPEKSN